MIKKNKKVVYIEQENIEYFQETINIHFYINANGTSSNVIEIHNASRVTKEMFDDFIIKRSQIIIRDSKPKPD